MIDRSIEEQLQALKLTPLQARDQDSWGFEINEARTRNSKLRIRMKDLHNYVAKLEVQNRRLEEERRIIQAGEMQSRQAGGDWRAKIEVLQREHLSYDTELRDKMRVKEEASLRNVEVQ